jgi:hypothetical protein
MQDTMTIKRKSAQIGKKMAPILHNKMEGKGAFKASEERIAEDPSLKAFMDVFDN